MSERESGGPVLLDRIGRPRSLAAIAADQIRELIITDRLKLGQQLSEASLAEQLGISRTPVRDALLRLQAERLVDIQPQLGSFVFNYDAKQLHSVLAVREILEVGALRMALKADRDKTLTALATAAASARMALAAGAEAYQASDTAYHEALVSASQNLELIDAYGRISGRIRAIRFRVNRSHAKFLESQDSHEAIVAALRDGDDQKAKEILEKHVYNSYFGYLEEIRRAGGPAEG
ncbi:GntR family transcriptional regulator [Labrys okinawensis]|uniref:GntR family transcriptional regulator n=1 Tax=Labrys okinawensis TaxID=346911 RepID=UPI0039BC771A